MNEMPPREEQMTQTKNATTKKKHGTAEQFGVRGLTTGQQVQESLGSQLQTLILQLLRSETPVSERTPKYQPGHCGEPCRRRLL